MNIFATYQDPTKSALVLDTKRQIKLILECSQMLSTALKVHTGQDQPRKSTHQNHPATVWARQNQDNYLWLLEHMAALCKEYTLGYEKHHKDEEFISHYLKNSIYIPAGNLTPFANCAAHAGKGITYKNFTDTNRAYRLYLAHRWETDTKTPQWTNIDSMDLVSEIQKEYQEFKTSI